VSHDLESIVKRLDARISALEKGSPLPPASSTATTTTTTTTAAPVKTTANDDDDDDFELFGDENDDVSLTLFD